MGRWLRRPEGSNWGDFGEDDRVGRMNLVTPERRRRAIAEAREGHVFLLGLPLDYPKGSMFPGRTPPGTRGDLRQRRQADVRLADAGQHGGHRQR